ncbi:CatB-related O-acetyltransferase [bacterium]|nr:CatB-related O-acetyltransferase [bacterium]
MKQFWINILADVLFFYSKKKRKAFRARHRRSAVLNRELRARGIIGRNTYVGVGSSISDKRTRIGNFCSVASNVVIGATSHPTDFLSTSPLFYNDMRTVTDGLVIPEDKRVDFTYSRPVVIGNDVWIGINAVIMNGVTIGDGAIIGAGAIVTHDVPPYAVALGVPARVVRYRFDEETIRRLLKARWWDQPDEVIASLKVTDVEDCLRQLERLSK